MKLTRLSIELKYNSRSHPLDYTTQCLKHKYFESGRRIHRKRDQKAIKGANCMRVGDKHLCFNEYPKYQ